MKNMMKMLITGNPLTLEEAKTLMDAVISGEMNPEQL